MSDEKLSTQLRAIADAAPAPGETVRDREIRRAIAAGQTTPVPRRRMLPWIAVGAGVLAAVAVLVLWLRGSGPPADVVVESGATDVAVAIDTQVTVVGTEPAIMRTADGSQVTAAAATQLARTDAAASHWRLARGRMTLAVTKRAPNTTFEVATDEATVTVVGTRFTVDRVIVDGRTTTHVAVEEGVVRVTPRAGEVVTLTAGQSWPAAITASADGLGPRAGEAANRGPSEVGASGDTAATDAAASGATTDAATAGATGGAADAGGASSATDEGANPPGANPSKPDRSNSRDGANGRDAGTGGTPPLPGFDARVIRSAIRAGNIIDARRLIDDQRKANASSRAVLAELGILAAEADLAERKTRAAIDKYLAVVRDFPTTAQAEQALFAAAQLAIDRPDAGYRPAALLRDYLDTYPRGQFAGDADRLLKSLAP